MEELSSTIKSKAMKDTAPGPDGLHTQRTTSYGSMQNLTEKIKTIDAILPGEEYIVQRKTKCTGGGP